MAAFVPIIMHAAMEQEAVVPDNQGILLPLHATLVMQLLRFALQEIQERTAFIDIPAHKPLEIGVRRK
jgi:hypothetical protein